MGPANTLTNGIHLMAKPAGPDCNLRCKYCFYLEKEALFHERGPHRMSAEVLEAYIQKCIQTNGDNPNGVLFSWQGGEPTLMGLDFFRHAVMLEKKYINNTAFSNTFQTNGTLLNDEWCEWLAKNNFLVGLSLDGTEIIHDRYRTAHAGMPTFKQVLNVLNLLRKHGVEFNIMACVARETAKYPLDVYHFFKKQGARFIQFSPIVERSADKSAMQLGLKFAAPPILDNFDNKESNPIITAETVGAQDYGDFLSAIFDEWVRNDVGKVFVMNFEWALFNYIGGDGAICYLSRRCGNALIVEYNGDVYSCDHFVYPRYKLGNILNDDIRALVASDKHSNWGKLKETMAPNECKKCEVWFMCRGGCPKDRIIKSLSGEVGLNYLCAGYRKFYNHTAKYMKAFHQLMKFNLPLDNIMKAIERPVVIPASPYTENQEVILWIR